jgi:hypothetical protein
VVLLGWVSAAAATATGALSIEVTPPKIALAGLSADVVVRSVGFPAGPERPVEIRDPAGSVLARGNLAPGTETTLTLEKVRDAGPYQVILGGPAAAASSFSLRVLPGWIALLPPLLAILLALVFRQVVPALVAGVWIGAWCVTGSPITGALRTIDDYVIRALADTDHVSIIVFSLMLGGMVGIMARAGSSSRG